MKKLILLFVILLSTGCFEESGQLVTVCTKNEQLNSLNIETSYSINFKTDIVEDVNVTYYYKDYNIDTLNSIKTSINTTDRFISGLRKNVLIDNDTEFKVSYMVYLDDEKEILNKFYVEEKRSNMIKNLESQGFTCK